MIVEGYLLDNIKHNLADLAKLYEHVFWLDSCSQGNAFGIGEYELLVGLGAKRTLDLIPGEFDWEEFNDFVSTNSWKFFALSYDLKTEIQDLPSSNHAHFHWPLISIVEPEIVVTISRESDVQVSGIHITSLTSKPQESRTSNFKLSFSHIRSSMTKSEHHARVMQIKHEIAKGNMYEMNLCMEHVLNDFACDKPFELFQRLINSSPTPFSAFVKLAEKHVLCASPERYLSVQDGVVYAQPIKGTSQRFRDENKDAASRLHLANSIKERAEHIMIVDLVRNDLSRLCDAGTVRVDELFGIYGYRHVNQMISTISGQLSNAFNFTDTIQATFPMGSMTGAPKYIVLKFIEELETAKRGWYSGSIGYIDPKGNMDSNVVIRSLLYDNKANCASFSVGGAITFDSDPDQEYEECLLKSKAIRMLLETNVYQ